MTARAEARTMANLGFDVMAVTGLFSPIFVAGSLQVHRSSSGRKVYER